MEYPHDFPEHLKRPVDAAIHAAEIAFIDAKQGIAPHRFQYEAESLVLRYVEAVFFGFATQAVQAGREGLWNGERIRKALKDFLDELGHRTYYDKHPDPGAYHGNEHFKTKLKNESKDWGGWRAIHEGLRQVAELRALPTEGASATLVNRRREPLEPRPDLLANLDISLSRLKAAEALGITPRTLDRWVADKKLTPFGVGLRKRFKAKDIQRVLNQKLLDKRDNK